MEEQLDKFNKLKKWIGVREENDYLELVISPYRKVIAKKDIPTNTLVFCVPDDKLIDNRCFTQLNKYEEYKNKIKSLNSLIALCLMQKMGEEYWKPYIELLPKNLDEFWYYMKPKVRELLKNSKLGEEILRFKESRFDEDLKILEEYFPELKIQENREKWIRSKLLVNSRVFGYVRNGESMSGLVPLADMLNHDINPNCNWSYEDEHKGFCMRSNREIKKGEEVLDSYGSKEGVRYYLLYAFIPHNMTTVNDVSINVDGQEIYTSTTIENLLNKYNGDKKKMFEILINKLKTLPTKKQLKEAGAYQDVITLVGHEKDILKKLITTLTKY